MQMSQIPITNRKVKCAKKFTPTTVPGNSTYSGITKHGRKLYAVGDSHNKSIIRNFVAAKPFSDPLMAQMSSSYSRRY